MCSRWRIGWILVGAIGGLAACGGPVEQSEATDQAYTPAPSGPAVVRMCSGETLDCTTKTFDITLFVVPPAPTALQFPNAYTPDRSDLFSQFEGALDWLDRASCASGGYGSAPVVPKQWQVAEGIVGADGRVAFAVPIAGTCPPSLAQYANGHLCIVKTIYEPKPRPEFVYWYMPLDHFESRAQSDTATWNSYYAETDPTNPWTEVDPHYIPQTGYTFRNALTEYGDVVRALAPTQSRCALIHLYDAVVDVDGAGEWPASEMPYSPARAGYLHDPLGCGGSCSSRLLR